MIIEKIGDYHGNIDDNYGDTVMVMIIEIMIMII